MKFSSKIERCELSPMRKYAPYADAAKARGMRIFPLNIGQPDIETPREFFEAVRNFSAPVLEYAPSDGVAEYLEAVRDYYNRIGQTDITKANILATNGGSEALWMTMSTILDDGDEIIVPEPYYPNYHTFVTLAGGKTCPIPTTPEEGYHYADREKIEALINEHTRAIMITNPGNPTGAVLTRAEMKMLAELAHERGLFLVADEVYREFSYDGEQMASMLEFPEAAENVIVIDSVSKRFSACGARIGAVISRNKDFLSEAMKVCQGRLCCPTIDQVGAAALYRVQGDYFAAVKEEYRRRRDTAYEMLMQIPNVVCRKPQGAFYLMAKLPVDSTDAFQIWMLEHFSASGDTVMITPGEGFYTTLGKGVNEARLAYVLKHDDLVRAMRVLAEGIEAYNNR
ncbi:MAG TPA: pyridoxal phosphate-dependent aminotransferase [Candidatus Scatomorpha merdigallinarum]|nr:pyridoxal phosphate-dependent aminotransferase [Candidatus Scatomorpha merdigallinarum]